MDFQGVNIHQLIKEVRTYCPRKWARHLVMDINS